MAEDETWQPDEAMQTFWWEFHKGRDYLKSLKKQLTAPSPPRPIQEGVKPVSKGLADVEESRPSTKTRAMRARHCVNLPIERPDGEQEAVDGLISLAKQSDADGKHGDGAGEDGAGAGKEGPADHKCTLKVIEKDQIKHELTRGSWEGLGMVHKGCKIHVEVCEPVPTPSPLILMQEVGKVCVPSSQMRLLPSG